MADRVREGGCACGAVRYRVRGEPIYVNNCHCRQCQQQTGSTSVVNAFIEAERFEILSGQIARCTVKAGSGGPHTIHRCAECGTAIYSHYPRVGELGVGIRVGTLDNPNSLTPDAVIFVAEKMPWVALPEGIPHFEAYYDQEEILPSDRFARIDALVRRKAEGG